VRNDAWHSLIRGLPLATIRPRDRFRFWSRVEWSPYCWQWGGCVGQKGHGLISFQNRLYHSNRVAWEFVFGPIPYGKLVLHTCDNPACVNPEHLWLGTVADNHRDMVSKSRNAMGEKHGAARLTTEQVKSIRVEGANKPHGIRTKLAKRYGVHRETVSAILDRRTWRHV
jgi:hypothetical protein